MSTIAEFAKEVMEALKQRGLEAVPCKNTKLNGVALNGLSFRKGNEIVAPVMYIDHYFDLYKDGGVTLGDIVDRIVCDYERLPNPTMPDLEGLLSSSDIIDRINLRLVNADLNREMIQDKHLIEYSIPDTDLTCLFYITVFWDEAGQGSIAISKELYDKYLSGIATGASELFEIITNRSTDVVLEPIEDMVEKLAHNALGSVPIPAENKGVIFVLTNRSMMNGASTILLKETAKKIRECFPDGIITVIPSSVNEILIMRTVAGEDTNYLREMVHEVNVSCLNREDFLSNNIYHFNANTGTLTIAQ